jgi:hypothetical protein
MSRCAPTPDRGLDEPGPAGGRYPLINWSDRFPRFKKFQEQVRNQKK